MLIKLASIFVAVNAICCEGGEELYVFYFENKEDALFDLCAA